MYDNPEVVDAVMTHVTEYYLEVSRRTFEASGNAIDVFFIVAYVALNIPFTARLMDGFFRAIPEEPDDAARIDGCSPWGALIRVAPPLALLGGTAAAIFAFLGSWNEFALASIIGPLTMDHRLSSIVYRHHYRRFIHGKSNRLIRLSEQVRTKHTRHRRFRGR